jgi:putative selenate reductase FAD-binding subunit
MIKQFFKPTSLEEAMIFKEKYGDSITWFAGGAYFNHISFQARYDRVISLEGLGLHAIHTKGNQTSIGATVTLQKLIDNGIVPKALRKAALQATTRTIRNMATVGGDIAVGGKSSSLIPCLIALNAKVVTVGKNSMPVETYLKADSRELILKLMLPEQLPHCYINQYALKANSPAIIKVAVSADPDKSKKSNRVTVAIGALEEQPRRLKKTEALVAKQSEVDYDAIAKSVSDEVEPVADIFGSVPFKKYISGITVADCVLSCLEKE